MLFLLHLPFFSEICIIPGTFVCIQKVLRLSTPMKNVALEAACRQLLVQRGAEFTFNFTNGLPYAAGVGPYMVLPTRGGGQRCLVLPKMHLSRQRTRWPNRDWTGPNAKLNKLGLKSKELRQGVLAEFF